MSRPSFRRQMKVEGLERRQVLSTASDGLTQEALYLLNLARTNPAEAASWINTQVQNDDSLQATLQHYGVNLQQTLSAISSATPQPPLALSSSLTSAALGHSQDMATNNFQGHTGSDGSTVSDRISAAGYGSASSEGEDAFAYASSVDNAIEAFLIDWGVPDLGHRTNILQPNVSANNAYSDVGIGIVQTDKAVGADVVTLDFAKSTNAQPQLIGTVYNDVFNTGFYENGDGQGGVTIQATNLSSGQVTSTTTSSAGGYQMALPAGNYQVSAVQNGQVVSSQNITMGSVNALADFDLSTPTFVSNPTPTPTPSPSPAPAPAPAPTPAPAPVTVNVSQIQSQPATPAPAAPSGSSIMSLLSSITSWSSYSATMQGNS
jgi:uncharacterized protein YkwD